MRKEFAQLEADGPELVKFLLSWALIGLLEISEHPKTMGGLPGVRRVAGQTRIYRDLFGRIRVM